MFSIAICVCDALGELIETAADKMLSSIKKTALRRDPEGKYGGARRFTRRHMIKGFTA
ncbi:hypothetical protein [Azotobacter chroococcum]|uniref:Uncharacterized protein n=1 Tax=Azotobacter chroococcum TaxID=353 RepID=A0AAQ0C041_9GAMM|nr:hypothetical protein [Azotobacter chroococcum]QQE88901.1 hypothetical protein GKQ51_00475 [Azotobacter chroococcum]